MLRPCLGKLTPGRALRPTSAAKKGETPMPMKETLAMVSLPMQEYRRLYDPAAGLARGTLFRELDMPWKAEKEEHHE